MVAFEASQPGRRPGLGTNANSVTPLRPRKPSGAALRDFRRQRFTRRQQSRSWLIDDQREAHGDDAPMFAPRVAKCGWASGAVVGVHKGDSGHARFSGVQSCGSVWSCPCCASVIRARRADEVQQAAEWWEHGREGAAASFVFATFTVRHYREDSLERSLSALTGAFRRVIRGKPWKSFAVRLGIEHMIKAVEVTTGWENGWHAHLHVLFFTESAASERALADAKGWLSARWADMVVREGGRRPSRARGVDVRTVRDGNVIAEYLTKLQEATEKSRDWRIGQEMARIDAKKGRLESLVPFDLLDVDGLDEEQAERQRAAWVEYVETTKGRRALTWSRGLKLAAGIEDVDDDEIVADEAADAEQDDLQVMIPREGWRKVCNDADVIARILDLCEMGRVEEIASLVPILWPDERVPNSRSGA